MLYLEVTELRKTAHWGELQRRSLGCSVVAYRNGRLTHHSWEARLLVYTPAVIEPNSEGFFAPVGRECTRRCSIHMHGSGPERVNDFDTAGFVI
jgi:hypothetical protein